MSSLESFIEETIQANSVGKLFEAYQRAMADIGFDRLIFSLMTEHKSLQKPAGHGIIANYPQDWMEYYLEKEFVTVDPVRQKMFISPGVFLWEGIPERQELSKKQRACLFGGMEAGLKSGIGIPLRGPRGAIAGIGAASSHGVQDLSPEITSKAHLLSVQFYSQFSALESKDDFSPPVILSDREREILQWCAVGKTREDIAEILSLSDHTVTYHVRNILNKFDAPNITSAAFKALRSGLIQL